MRTLLDAVRAKPLSSLARASGEPLTDHMGGDLLFTVASGPAKYYSLNLELSMIEPLYNEPLEKRRACKIPVL